MKIKLSLSQLEKLEKEKISYKSEKTLKEYKTIMKSDWKPTGHERAAMATITSIQIYDTQMKMFFIFALNKDWTRQNVFNSNHGPVKYIKCTTEEEMLKKFLELLRKRDPAIMSGWNTAGYDDPFVTNRIIRVLDKRDDLYYYDELKVMWKFNTDCLNGEYVKQLSPHAGLIQHREVQTNFGIQDEFKWVGIIQEDYLDLYKKYTYTIHTSYSLDTVAGFELGSNKVNHDEFADFKAFYEGDYKAYAYDDKKEEKNELDNLYLELTGIDKELARRSL